MLQSFQRCGAEGGGAGDDEGGGHLTGGVDEGVKLDVAGDEVLYGFGRGNGVDGLDECGRFVGGPSAVGGESGR